MHHKTGSAFTLIELLIVVAIIGILAAVAVPNFLNAQVRARIARVHTDQRAIGQALDMYHLDHSAHPPFYNWPLFGIAGVPRLTSPVAYIATYPNDPFRRAKAGSGVEETFNHVKMAYYNLTIMEETGQARGSTRFGVEAYRQGHRYGLRSFGPNRLADYDSTRDVYPDYHATNGLHSIGDIYRWGP